MIALFLGVLAGTCFYAAFHHLLIGIRLRPRSPHLLLAVSGLAFGAMAVLNVLSYREITVHAAELQQKSAVALALLGVLALYWFVGLRAAAPRRFLYAISVFILLAMAADLVSPAGLLVDRIRGFEPVALPWGETFYAPLGEASPLELWILMPALVLPLIFLGYAIRLLWRKERRGEALALAAILVVPAVPSIIDLATHGPGGQPLPLVETALASAMLLLSLVTAGDLAETASLETELEQSEARFRRLVETSPEAIGLYDARRRRFVAVNGRIEALLGRTAEEILSFDLESLFAAMGDDSEDDLGRFSEYVARARAGDAPVAERWIRRKDGTRVPCEGRFSALETDEGTMLLRVSILDISERKRAEEERQQLEHRLHRAERLETLGALAGGIAHDFNNMLTPVVGYGEMAAAELEGHPARPYLDEILVAADKAHELTQDILMFSRQAELAVEELYVQPVIEEACRFLRATLPSRIRVQTGLDAPAARIRGDEGQLRQVVMALGANAAHAMPDGGRLHVTLREDGERVVFEMADTGTGMDADTVDRVFDPFFSTKETVRASGLGLSIVHGIVTSWSGDIDLDTEPGVGTTVRISLPRVSPEPA